MYRLNLIYHEFLESVQSVAIQNYYYEVKIEIEQTF